MKYLKTFEYERKYKTRKPKVNDWVVIKLHVYENPRQNKYPKIFQDFVHNNPGKVTQRPDNTSIFLEYENIPREIKNMFTFKTRPFYIEEIDYVSNDKNDAEAYINMNKYNL